MPNYTIMKLYNSAMNDYKENFLYNLPYDTLTIVLSCFTSKELQCCIKLSNKYINQIVLREEDDVILRISKQLQPITTPYYKNYNENLPDIDVIDISHTNPCKSIWNIRAKIFRDNFDLSIRLFGNFMTYLLPDLPPYTTEKFYKRNNYEKQILNVPKLPKNDATKIREWMRTIDKIYHDKVDVSLRIDQPWTLRMNEILFIIPNKNNKILDFVSTVLLKLENWNASVQFRTTDYHKYDYESMNSIYFQPNKKPDSWSHKG